MNERVDMKNSAGIMPCVDSRRKKPFILGRSDAYIGVLVRRQLQKTAEPYRLTTRAGIIVSYFVMTMWFTFAEKGRELGLIDDERYAKFQAKQKAIEAEIETYAIDSLEAFAPVTSVLSRKKDLRNWKTASFSDLLKRLD